MKQENSQAPEHNLGSAPENPDENLKVAEGKNIAHHAPDVVGADELPGKNTARGRYGESMENADAADFFADPHPRVDEPELGSLK